MTEEKKSKKKRSVSKKKPKVIEAKAEAGETFIAPAKSDPIGLAAHGVNVTDVLTAEGLAMAESEGFRVVKVGGNTFVCSYYATGFFLMTRSFPAFSDQIGKLQAFCRKMRIRYEPTWIFTTSEAAISGSV